MVLLHGFLSSSKYWKRLQPLLSQAGYRVITVDLLGFGNAAKPTDAHYNYDDHVEYLHATLRQLGVSESFILIGHSMGGLIAARYGKTYPDSVQSLILLHPPLYADTAEAQQTLRNTGILYRILLDSPYRQLIWLALRGLGYSIIGKHSRLSREASLQNVIESAEMFDDLADIATPSLLVVGKADRKEYIANIAQFDMSSSVTVSLEPVDHHSPRNQPQLIRGKIIEFIS